MLSILISTLFFRYFKIILFIYICYYIFYFFKKIFLPQYISLSVLLSHGSSPKFCHLCPPWPLLNCSKTHVFVLDTRSLTPRQIARGVTAGFRRNPKVSVFVSRSYPALFYSLASRFTFGVKHLVDSSIKWEVVNARLNETSFNMILITSNFSKDEMKHYKRK